MFFGGLMNYLVIDERIAWQVAEGAKAAGASRIIGIDIDSKKFDVGKSWVLSSLSFSYSMAFSADVV